MAEEKFRWVVSKGEYSDYTVMCVCDSQKRAELVAALYNADEDPWGKASVEQMPFVDYTPTKITVHHLSVQVWDDGTTSEQHQSAREEWPFAMLYPEYVRPVSWRWVRAPVHNGKGGRLDVSGTDLGKVRRTLSDKRAQLLADESMRKRREIKSR